MAYTDLTKIAGPSEAYAGETVEIYVYIKNLTSGTIGIKPRAIVNDTIEVVFTVPYANHPPGVEYYYTGHFTMPNADAVIRGESYWYGSDGEWHFDDTATQTVKLAGPELETLRIDITPEGGGYVTTSPVSEEGNLEWHNGDTGTFPHGTDVQVTAHPEVGYKFDHWSSEIVGGVSYQNPEHVRSMTEHRAVTAHFRRLEGPEILQIKEVRVPESARAGELVTVEVVLINNFSYSFLAIPTAAVDSLFLHFGGRWVVLGPQTTFTWTDTFVMPDHDVLVHVEAWAEGVAYEYDSKDATVALEEEELETLRIDITPVGAGYVTTDPVCEEGKVFLDWEWNNGDTGTFPYGTQVKVTAHPHTGYVFEKWSGEIVGGVSYDNPSYVQNMTEHRRVTCHFRAEEEPPVETLKVEITPIGKGYVTTSPASEEGKTTWHDGETGTFPHGTNVEVTAVPDEGWVFEKWSHEIAGGVSYDNPAMVQTMDEHRSVTCHFITKEEAEAAFSEFHLNYNKVGAAAGTQASLYPTGWYQDPSTGTYYYYDSVQAQWYTYAAGYLYPLSVPKESAPKVVDIAPGDTLRMEYRYKYVGPAVDVTEYATIGYTSGIGFLKVYTEKVKVSKSRTLPQSDAPTEYTGSLDLVLPANAGANWNDIECKVFNGGKELGINYQDALNVIGVEVVFSELTVVDYYKKTS